MTRWARTPEFPTLQAWGNSPDRGMRQDAEDAIRKSRGSDRARDWAAFGVGLLYALICLPPWVPAFLTDAELRDPSWQYALHEAFAQGVQFGTQVLFTYGPYGFVATRTFHPATYTLMLAVWVALGVTLFAHTWRLARRSCSGPWTALLVSAVAVRIAAVDVMTLLTSFLVLLLLRESQSRPADERHSTWKLHELIPGAGLVLAVGFLPLTKFTFVPATALVLAAIAVRDVLRRRFPFALLFVLVASCALWALAGQTWGGLGDYLANGFEIAGHYEPAMSLWESRPFDVAAVWFAAMLVVLVPFLLRSRESNSRGPAAYVIPLTLAALLFLVWKFTFVRFHPQKTAIFFSTALLIAVYCVLARSSPSADSRRRSWIAVSLPAVLLTATGVAGGLGVSIGDILWSSSQNPAAAATWLWGDGWMQIRHRNICRGIRRRHPLPDLRGTIDVVPDKLAVALARNDVRFQGRPVMQSYVAFTPELAEANAAHYRSADAPDHVLFRVNPIDGRYPSLCDGRLWRELLRRYEVAGSYGGDLLLRKLDSQRTLRVVEHVRFRTTWNAQLAVPPTEGGFIWCRVTIRRNLAGKLAALLYKLPPVTLEVATQTGARRFRFVPGAGESGFLLSPQVLSKEDFASLLPGDAGLKVAPHVTFLRLATSAESFYADAVDVEFERVTISPPPIRRGVPTSE